MEPVSQLETVVLVEYMGSGLGVGFLLVSLGGFTSYVVDKIAKLFESIG